MNEMVEDGGLPDGGGVIGGENIFEAMGSEGSEGDAEEPHDAGDLSCELHVQETIGLGEGETRRKFRMNQERVQSARKETKNGITLRTAVIRSSSASQRLRVSFAPLPFVITPQGWRRKRGGFSLAGWDQ